MKLKIRKICEGDFRQIGNKFGFGHGSLSLLQGLNLKYVYWEYLASEHFLWKMNQLESRHQGREARIKDKMSRESSLYNVGIRWTNKG